MEKFESHKHRPKARPTLELCPDTLRNAVVSAKIEGITVTEQDILRAAQAYGDLFLKHLATVGSLSQ